MSDGEKGILGYDLTSKRFAATWLLFALSLFGACGEGTSGSDDSSGSGASSASELVARGETLYGETCAVCHGSDLEGSETGPPFLSPIYAPNHHPDESFFAAVADGVQPHHWDFGAMPAQPSVSPDEVEAIVAFVRAEQEAAGITEDPSHP
jgi:mono/diheme cytochrome c family protein